MENRRTDRRDIVIQPQPQRRAPLRLYSLDFIEFLFSSTFFRNSMAMVALEWMEEEKTKP